MTKRELIERVYKARGLSQQATKKTVGLIVDQVFAQIGDYFIKARGTRGAQPRFTYPGFGTFARKRRADRQGRNPQTGEPITIPAQTTLTFAPGQDLKSLLNRQ